MEDEIRRQQQEQLAAEREKRIEHTKEMAVRRVFKRELSRGWTCWYDAYWTRVRQKRLLAAAANRLFRPKLVRGFGLWRRVVALEKKAWDTKEYDKRFKEMSKEQQALATSLADTQREYDNRRTLDNAALLEERRAMTALQKELAELRTSLADEQARNITTKAKEDKAAEALKAERERSAHANEMLNAQQKAAKVHLEEQLVKVRAELSGELSGAHKTIAELKKQLAQLQAEKIKRINSGDDRSAVLATPPPDNDDGGRKKSIKPPREKTSGVLGVVDFDEDRPPTPPRPARTSAANSGGAYS